MAKILYGAPVREAIKIELIERVNRLGKELTLVVVQVGDRPDSNLYIKNKIKFGEEIGAEVVLNKFSEDISQKELEAKIKELAKDKKIDGMIVQLPLPSNIDSEKILNLIPKSKDADGLVSLPKNSAFLFESTDKILPNFSSGPLQSGSQVSQKEMPSFVTPATARAVMALLDFYKIEVKNKKIAVIGRSKLAGGPIADELQKRGAVIFRCDINTKNIPEICSKTDILISATGCAGLITKEFVSEGQVVIDVGTNRSNGKLVGDVVFGEIEPLVSAITPVPGGVGPVTVSCLFQNLLDLCYNGRRKE